MQIELWLLIAGSAGIALAGLVIGILSGIAYRKKIAEAEIGSAEEQARKILEDSLKNAEQKKKEALLEAKEQIIKEKNETEAELKERRKEVSRLERRVIQKEEALDAKIESIEKKDEALQKKIHDNEELSQKIKETLSSHIAMLEKISGYSAEQAKAELLSRVVK